MGSISVTCAPKNAVNTIIINPMSWYSGSQLTHWTSVFSPPCRIICIALVYTPRWVISTPAGVRVEPDVYCR